MPGGISSGEEIAISPPPLCACLKEEKKIWVGRLGKRRRRKRSTCESVVPFKGSFRVELALSKRVFHSRLRNFLGSFLRNLLCMCQGECLGQRLEKPRPYLLAWQNLLRSRETIFKVLFLFHSTLQEKSASAVYEPYGSFLFLVFCFDR